MDNLNIKFPNNLFDIITARHTIIDAVQIYNCLSNNGVLIIEGVDKYDCWELKRFLIEVNLLKIQSLLVKKRL